MLGEDADRLHEQIDALLDGEDAMIVLVDSARMISYAHGFGTSPSHLELLALEIERAVRRVAGPPVNGRGNRAQRCQGRQKKGRERRYGLAPQEIQRPATGRD